jgi:hypothetical protein
VSLSKFETPLSSQYDGFAVDRGRLDFDPVHCLHDPRKPGQYRTTCFAVGPELLKLQMVSLIWDSPDDFRTGVNTPAFPAFLQARREVWTATSASGSRNGGQGLIWPFSLAFGRTPPVDCL